MDPLQDISYVIYAPLLDVQDLGRPVQIHHSISRLGEQVQEALGGQVQGGVVTRFLRYVPRYWMDEKTTEFISAAVVHLRLFRS